MCVSVLVSTMVETRGTLRHGLQWLMNPTPAAAAGHSCCLWAVDIPLGLPINHCFGLYTPVEVTACQVLVSSSLRPIHTLCKFPGSAWCFVQAVYSTAPRQSYRKSSADGLVCTALIRSLDALRPCRVSRVRDGAPREGGVGAEGARRGRGRAHRLHRADVSQV